MSVAESDALAAPAEVVAPQRLSTRFFRSELLLIFGRRRNWVGMAVLATVPILIIVAVKLSPPSGDGGPDFINQITQNGIFAALTALTLEMPLFLPVAVAAISADSVAGEANLGTLRYLLAVPVDRTRLLVVKLGAITVFAFAATMVVAGVGALLGLAVFGAGPMVSLSGSQLPFWDGVLRLVLVCLYLTVCLTALGAIGMFVSTLTEQPIGAAVAILVLAVGSQIMDAIPQLSAIHTYLPTHYWLAFGDLLRDPIALDRTVPGLLSALAYVAIFGTAAWARFGGRDVTS
ncbi:MAG: ABC transporter permease [Actinobacteria bacterium]|nr:MAG: ABC transporter permease [Actinomycetota bacterium]